MNPLGSIIPTALAPPQPARRAVKCLWLTFALLFVTSPHAIALTITPVFDSSITNDPNSATIQETINEAIAVFENTCSDPVSVTIEFHEVNSGLGASVHGVG